MLDSAVHRVVVDSLKVRERNRLTHGLASVDVVEANERDPVIGAARGARNG